MFLDCIMVFGLNSAVDHLRNAFWRELDIFLWLRVQEVNFLCLAKSISELYHDCLSLLCANSTFIRLSRDWFKRLARFLFRLRRYFSHDLFIRLHSIKSVRSVLFLGQGLEVLKKLHCLLLNFHSQSASLLPNFVTNLHQSLVFFHVVIHCYVCFDDARSMVFSIHQVVVVQTRIFLFQFKGALRHFSQQFLLLLVCKQSKSLRRLNLTL